MNGHHCRVGALLTPLEDLSTHAIERLAAQLGAIEPVCSRVGPNAVRIDVRAPTSSADQEALRETIARRTGLAVAVQEKGY